MSETFRKFRALLTGTVTSYNDIRRTCRKVEFKLIELEVATVDKLIERGQKELQWNSRGLLEYMQELGGLVDDLYKRVKLSQSNVEKVRSIIEPWTKMPLIERKDRRKQSLLFIDDRVEKVAKRYAEICKAAEQISQLMADNKNLFEIKDESNETWQSYVRYVDKIVIESLRKSVGCSLGYLAENMDPTGQSEPLLEAQLELREPDLFFVPSLEPDDPDGLEQLVSSLLSDITGMAKLVPRLKQDLPSYAEEIENDEDICGMKNEILTAVNKAIDEATDFCGVFEGKLSLNDLIQFFFSIPYELSMILRFNQVTHIYGSRIEK